MNGFGFDMAGGLGVCVWCVCGWVATQRAVQTVASEKVGNGSVMSGIRASGYLASPRCGIVPAS
jgi:hypothetical protein